jgi:two-component system, OmpR family, KDP operon response regulator KdpE
VSRILVVDDEPQILKALQTGLRGAGYEVDTATTGAEALTAAAVQPPDAVILDLVLPDTRGTDVCRELRTWSGVPVIVLSAVGDEGEKVAALDAGADDYVTKPFGLDELLARLRAALRRVDGTAEPMFEIGELRVDLAAREVSFAGAPVQLTPHEFGLLALLARNQGKLLTHRPSSRRSGDTRTTRSPITCTSMCRSCGASSSPSRLVRATSSRSRVRDTGSSIR